jgi:hypothetical protein
MKVLVNFGELVLNMNSFADILRDFSLLRFCDFVTRSWNAGRESSTGIV